VSKRKARAINPAARIENGRGLAVIRLSGARDVAPITKSSSPSVAAWPPPGPEGPAAGDAGGRMALRWRPEGVDQFPSAAYM